MPQTKSQYQVVVFDAQQKIFNKLCAAYRHSRQNPDFSVRAEDVRIEFGIPPEIFVKALANFVDASGETIVEVFDQQGENYLRLGEVARFNLND